MLTEHAQRVIHLPFLIKTLARNIIQSIYIRINNPTLNNNIGKFNLPHIWHRVLLNTKNLNLKRQVNNNNTQPYYIINLS